MTSFKENFNFITNIFILSILFIGGLIYADTNGIWNFAEDVRPGTFGLDEGANPLNNYTFINPVYFEENVFGKEIYSNGQKVLTQNFVENNYYNKTQVDSIVGSGSTSGNMGFGVFGDYETKSVNTVYQAQTDGIVIVNGLSASGFTGAIPNRCDLFGYIGNTSTSVTTRLITGSGINDYGQYVGYSFPVKAGKYWKVVRGLSSNGPCYITINWLPIIATQNAPSSGGGG